MFTLDLKGACPMSPIVYRMNGVLSHVVQRVPVGTNLGLLHCLWMLLSGRLLLSRGAVIPGLAALGLAAAAVRRAWAALAYGQWHAAQLLEACAHLSTSRRAGLSSPSIQGRGGNPPAARWSARCRVPTRGARLPRHPRTAMKPGSSVLGQPPCRCTRHFGT